MGTSIGDFVTRNERTLDDLSGQGYAIAAVDSYVWMYQFLHKIRDYSTGEPLKDSEGRITSHLQGLFYRTANLLEADIQPIFVYEGGYPELKEEEIQGRNTDRDKAQREYEIAKMAGNDSLARDLEIKRRGVSDEMVQTAIDLVDAMGCPHIIPPEEGEAQCARMCASDQVDYVISADYDTLLYGSPHLLQNLNSESGDHIVLSDVLNENGFSHKELIWLGMLMGTDYNSSPHGVGKVTAENIVREATSLGEIIDEAVAYDESIDEERWRTTYELFVQPNVNIDIEHGGWSRPNPSAIREILVEKHNFSKTKVGSALDGIATSTEQSTFHEFSE